MFKTCWIMKGAEGKLDFECEAKSTSTSTKNQKIQLFHWLFPNNQIHVNQKKIQLVCWLFLSIHRASIIIAVHYTSNQLNSLNTLSMVDYCQRPPLLDSQSTIQYPLTTSILTATLQSHSPSTLSPSSSPNQYHITWFWWDWVIIHLHSFMNTGKCLFTNLVYKSSLNYFVVLV